MHESLIKNLQTAGKGSSRVSPASDHSTSRRIRRSRRPPTMSKTVRFQLSEFDGVMEWHETTGAVPDLGKFRTRYGGVPSGKGAIADIEFERLPPSQVTQFLEARDKKLTPNRGLRRYDVSSRTLKPAKPPKTGSALVFIHGTFSNNENLLGGFSAPGADEFLAKASNRYKGNIFTFDHATLSVGPILNAMDLARCFADSKAKVDIVSHSRGGLIGRWWAESIDPNGDQCRKAILVGAPLAGTGLAAPPNIRATISMLTKFGDLLETAAGIGSLAVPVLSVVEALLQVVTSITSFVAKTPVIDAAMAMVPGLFAMSRVGNNPELRRLLERSASIPDRYYAIKSNFEPTDPRWKFWRALRGPRVANSVADRIFDGDNDLVVDTPSMDRLSDDLAIPKKQILNFGTSQTVHHLNYFRQPETMQFLSEALL